jgi:nucleoside-diphosphate-sugar epimerase
MMQTIIGSGGAIGIPLARELKNYTDQIRLVSRNPKKVNDTDELFPADAYDYSQVNKAIAGSEVVYVTIGFEYKLKVWQKTWPTFMQQVINSCKKHNAKLVFFDNIYMYSKTAVPFMTEDSAIDPPSEKGKVREHLREMIIDEVEKKNLTALIARAGDFYGPDNKNSALTIMVADNLMKGKKAQAFGNINKIHTYTYTPDAAKATAILGNTSDAFNQEWHLPTTKEKLTTLGWIELIAKELKKEPKIQTVPAWMLYILGIFVPVMREFPEMLYQYEQDYIFDSSKFEKRFGIFATTPEIGIKKTIATAFPDLQ